MSKKEIIMILLDAHNKGAQMMLTEDGHKYLEGTTGAEYAEAQRQLQAEQA